MKNTHKIINFTQFIVILIFTFINQLATYGEPDSTTLLQIIRGDGSTESKDRFIIPNEKHFYLFNSSLKDKTDILMGVGSFRFFHDVSQGNFSYAISFDYSSEIIDFNLGIIKLLKNSENRLSFLSNLVGNPSFIQSLQKFESGLIDKVQIQNAIIEILEQNTLFEFFKHENIFPETISKTTIKKFTLAMFDIFLNTTQSKLSFLGSDTYFAKLKRLVDDDRIYVVHGDLSGTVTLQNLVKVLQKRGLKISVLDISNAFDYITKAQAGYQFLENLKNIPFSENASILFTHANIPGQLEGGDGWDYYAVPAKHYLKWAEVFAPVKNINKYPFPYHRFMYDESEVFLLKANLCKDLHI